MTRSCRKRSSFACSAAGRSPISSRNSVPPWAVSILPGVCFAAPVNAPFLVAEQLALEQVLGNRRAIDGDEPARAARREVVQRAREELLAGAGFAEQHHRGVGRGATFSIVRQTRSISGSRVMMPAIARRCAAESAGGGSPPAARAAGRRARWSNPGSRARTAWRRSRRRPARSPSARWRGRSARSAR